MTTFWYDPSRMPAFDSPPVAETAMSFEYPALVGVDVIKLVQLQNAWRGEYPVLSEVPGALPTQMEPENGMVFNFGDGPRRIWASNQSNGLLLQTQNDRIALNWRKAYSEGMYPGYTLLREEFSRRWVLMLAWLSQEGLSRPEPHLAEFTYVNHVPLADGELMSDVLTIVSDMTRLPGKESFGSFQFVREVRPGDHPFPAQIHIQGQPLQTPAGSMLAFTVTTRVLITGGTDAAFDGLNAAHALASHSFAGLVTERKQQVWGRTQ